jgi:isoleucyl-tRNA synthetase
MVEAVDGRLRDYDAEAATRQIARFVDDLSTWYLRLSRKRMSRGAGADRDAAFATLHTALVTLARTMAPILPFLSEAMYGNLVTTVEPEAPDSVHLTRFPSGELDDVRDPHLVGLMDLARRSVDLIRTLRGQAGLRVRQPLARAWLAIPGGMDAGQALAAEGLLDLISTESNVKAVELVGDESELVDRRVKPLLPKIGKRLGSAIPGVMAAARAGDVEIHGDGSVTLGGVTLAPDEVEIQASPREGTVVAHDDGLVVIIDTTLTADLRAEGDARELQRAIQDLRKDAGLELDDRIELWVSGLAPEVAAFLDSVAAETLADVVHREAPPARIPTSAVRLGAGEATIGVRRLGGAA